MYSAQFFKSLLEISTDIYISTNEKNELIFFSSRWSDQVGSDCQTGAHLEKYIHPEDFQALCDLEYRKSLKIRVFNHKTKSYDFYEFLKNETTDGFTFFVCRRVDEIVRAKSFLNKLEKVSGIGYWEIDLHTKNLFWSEQTHRIHETDPATYYPKLEDGLSFFHADSIPALTEGVQRLIESGIGYDLKLKFITSKGNHRWVRAISGAEKENGKVVRVFGSFQDITVEIATEEANRLANERFKVIVENIPVMLSVFDENGKFEWCNRAWERELGWDEKIMHKIDTLAEFYPDESERSRVLQFMISGSGWQDFQTMTRYGHKIYTSWANVKLSNGKAVGIGMNIDEKVKLQKQADELIADIKNFFELSNDMLSISNFEGYFLKLNPAWCRTLGYTEAELLSRPYAELIHPDDVASTQKAAEEMSKGSQVFHFENRYRTKAGDYRLLSWVSHPLLETGKAYAVARDMTDERAREQKLQMASKMSTLGEMASGIAHEINNPLAIIAAKASLVARNAKKGSVKPEVIVDDMQKIEMTAERIAKIVRGLRSFSRDASQDPHQIVQLEKVVNEVSEFCAERFKSHLINLKVELAEGLQFFGNPTQISQVLLNLLNNAHDAVLNQEDRWVSLSAKAINGTLKISVMDSGPGIPKQVQEKMMNPFFTTKEVGKGTGLGLSIAKGIVEDHKGQIYYNEKSTNTEFIIELPI
jgi:PAS domain S-box-containing protein